MDNRINQEADTPNSSTKQKSQLLASYLTFKLDVRLFKFRGDNMPKG